MENVLITGGTGLIGTRLTEMLMAKGFSVSHLSRSRSGEEQIKTYLWNIKEHYIEMGAVENADYIIHLAGASLIGKRWTKSYKKEIIDSRVESAKLLYRKIQEKNAGLKGFISSSAVGYYGAVTTDKIFRETDPPGNDFVAKTCVLWEKAAKEFSLSGIRTVIIRNGVALSKNAIAMKLMALPVLLYIGAPVGSGKQYFPWIHLDDLCRMYVMAIENEHMQDVYNGVAPEHITNEAFTKLLAKTLKRPLFMPPVPGFVLKLLFGESGETVLEGSRVSCEKITRQGFEFEFPQAEKALEDCYG